MKENKRIISIGHVKDEADIIESFVRHAFTYSDVVILKEEHSSDNTMELLEKLIEEYSGRLIVSHDSQTDIGIAKDILINQLISYAFEQFDADVVIPIDADEFLISQSNLDVKTIINSMNINECYLCKWRTYVWYKLCKEQESFVPNNFSYYRSPQIMEEMTKVIIFRSSWFNNNLSITLGNHNIISPNANYHAKETNELVFAHYPVRSKNQLIRKMLRNYMRFAININSETGASYHIIQMYNSIKKNNFKLSDNDILDYSFNYGSKIIVENQKELVECLIESNNNTLYPKIECKYKPKELDLVETVLTNFLSLSNTYTNNNPSKFLKRFFHYLDKEIKIFKKQTYSKMEFNDRILFHRRVCRYKLGKIFTALVPNKISKLLKKI